MERTNIPTYMPALYIGLVSAGSVLLHPPPGSLSHRSLPLPIMCIVAIAIATRQRSDATDPNFFPKSCGTLDKASQENIRVHDDTGPRDVADENDGFVISHILSRCILASCSEKKMERHNAAIEYSKTFADNVLCEWPPDYRFPFTDWMRLAVAGSDTLNALVTFIYVLMPVLSLALQAKHGKCIYNLPDRRAFWVTHGLLNFAFNVGSGAADPEEAGIRYTQ